jgi:hypothetical protein
MEGGDSSGAGAGGAVAAAAKWRSDASRAFQYYLDRSTPHATGRWLGTLAAAAIYALRVYMVQGFYIVTYGLGIYLLNLLIGFLSPMVDPELDPSAASEGPALPTRGSDEFKPFIRRLPEFKFWLDLSSSPPDLSLRLARSVWPSYYLRSAGVIRSSVMLVCIYLLERGDRIRPASLVLAVLDTAKSICISETTYGSAFTFVVLLLSYS